MLKRNLQTTIFILLSMLLMSASLVQAQTGGILSNNTGSSDRTFFITGEPTLVMNGFDLNARGLARPVTLNTVSLSVDTPVTGASAELVVYQDANGGSPVDARLVSRQTVNITTAGLFTFTFPTAVQITEPVVWIGFYLPVDFKFNADRSGTSVLTYWAWTPGTTFDLSNLSTASVFGPGDGTTPVSINMGGVARITAGVNGGNSATAPVGGTTGGTSQPARAADGRLIQTPGDVAQADLSVLRGYANCSLLSYDGEDIGVTLGGAIGPTCNTIWAGYTPGNPLGYTQIGELYGLTFFNDEGTSIAGELPAEITHCFRPVPERLTNAVIGLAYGVPERWEILPTQRYGDVICAEVKRGGLISYFIPN